MQIISTPEKAGFILKWDTWSNCGFEFGVFIDLCIHPGARPLSGNLLNVVSGRGASYFFGHSALH